ncbi:MAG: mechanosensitive ion channel domain-containing protein [Myxococcota bacterium]
MARCRRVIRRFAAALIAVCICSLPAYAQEEPDGPEVADDIPPEALPDLLDAADEVRDRLIQVDAQLGEASTPEETEADAVRVDALIEKLRTQAEAAGSLLEQPMSPAEIESAVRRWQIIMEDIEGEKEAVESRIEELETTRAELQELSKRWLGIRDAWRSDSSVSTEVLEPAQEQIESLLSSISERIKEFTRRLEPLLEWQSSLAMNRRAAGEIREKFRSKSALVRSRLFESDSPPLWQSGPTEASWSEQFQETVRRIQRSFWEEFWPRYGSRTPIHGVLVVVLLVTAGWVWLRRRRYQEDGFDSDERRLSDRAFSAALILGLLASLPFYPRMPTAIGLVLGLVGLYPVLRVATRLVDHPLDRLLWLLGGLFVVHRFYLMLGSQSRAGRILLVADGLATIALLILVLRSPARRRLAESNQIFAATVLLLPIFIALLLIGVVAEVFGLARLAGILVGGTLLSVYAAVVLSTATTIVLIVARLLLKSPVGQRFRSVRLHGSEIEREFSRWLRFGAVVWWLAIVLRHFSVRESVFAWMGSVLSYPITMGSLTVRMQDILLLLVTLWISLQLSRFVRFALEEEALPPLSLARGVPTAISRGASYVVITLGFLFAFASAGIDVNQLTVLFGAFGVGIGFGLQNLVNNFVSGLILIFERPIQVGDLVEFQNQMGHVRGIGIRASVVRTFSGAELIVPNGDLVSSQVTNWNLSDRRRRVEIQVQLPVESDPQPAIDIMVGAATAHPNVSEDPAPTVCARGFDEGAMLLELWCWTSDTSVTIETKSDLTLVILRRFRENGIRFAVPRRALRWEQGMVPDNELKNPSQELEERSSSGWRQPDSL